MLWLAPVALLAPCALLPAQAACRLLGKRLAEWVAVFCDGRKDQHPLVKADTRLPPG